MLNFIKSTVAILYQILDCHIKTIDVLSPVTLEPTKDSRDY